MKFLFLALLLVVLACAVAESKSYKKKKLLSRNAVPVPRSAKSPKSGKSSKSSKSSKSPKSPKSPDSGESSSSLLSGSQDEYLENHCTDKPLINMRVCSVPVDTRDCGGSQTRYYYNIREKLCRPFTDGGCEQEQNAVNSFETLEACEDACPLAMCHTGGCNAKRLNCSKSDINFCILSKTCYLCKCTE